MRPCFVIVGLLVAGFAHAQSTLTQNLSADMLPTWSGNFALGYNSNLYEPGTASQDRNVSGDLTVNYRAAGANLVRGFLSGYKQLDQGEEWRPNDGWVGWVNNAFWHKGEKYTLGQQVRVHIPASKESRDRDTKVTGVSLVPVFQANLAPTVLFIYQPQFIKNAHTYEVSRANVSNTSWAINQVAILSWSITDALYFQPSLVYGTAWSYNETKKDDVFIFASEFGYGINQTFTVAAGWSNSGAIRSLENGNDQTIRVFDENTSTVYAALYLVF